MRIYWMVVFVSGTFWIGCSWISGSPSSSHSTESNLPSWRAASMILSTSNLRPPRSSSGRMTSWVMGTETVVVSVLTRRSRTDMESVDSIPLKLVHVGKELGVVADFFEAADEEFHSFSGRQRVEDLAEDPDALEVFLGDEQLFLTGAGALDVDGRKDSLVDELAVKDD